MALFERIEAVDQIFDLMKFGDLIKAYAHVPESLDAVKPCGTASWSGAARSTPRSRARAWSTRIPPPMAVPTTGFSLGRVRV